MRARSCVRPYGRSTLLGGLTWGCLAACGSGAGSPHGTPLEAGLPEGGRDASLHDAGTDSGHPRDAGDGGHDAAPSPPAFVPTLGGSFDPVHHAYVFRVRSANATHLEVDLFAAPLDQPAVLTQSLTREAASDVWSATVSAADVAKAGIPATVYYGYRAWGPNWTYDASFTPGSLAGYASDVDGAGNRFNPNKLLIDPYTREISQDPESPGHTDGSVYGTGDGDRGKDSAPSASKSLVLASDALDTGKKPSRPLSDDIVYEVHVRGLTENDPHVKSCAGTYAGAAEEAATLHARGVTAIELLPIEETQNDTNDLSMSSSGQNYWGYSTLADLAPDRRYACDRSAGGPTREFAAMVKAFHAVGIKVFLDVVYNHTAEGGGSALLSWRGLDNASYYELGATGASFYDDTGIGANFNVANPIARDLVVDSLKYWSLDMGVDGFRFDLAAVLGNSCAKGCFAWNPEDPAGILERAVNELPGGTALIAEPWGVAAGTYELGQFPEGWSEWNGQFRDSIRTAENKEGVIGTAPSVLQNDWLGSPSLFASSRGPTASINYVVSHDGFTLRDLYACNAADNGQAWPYGPSSGGTADNLSWDQGGSAALQEAAERAGLALVATAAGVPMITGGDEMGRSLHCNNNPYNLDSIGNWLDWPDADDTRVTFVTGLFAFRSAHPALRPTTFRGGVDHNGNGLADVTWLTAGGDPADAGYLSNAANTFLAMRIDGTEVKDPAASIEVAYNAAPGSVQVTLPPALKSWYLAVDTGTALSSGGWVATPGSEPPVSGGVYTLGARSVALFIDR